MNNKRYVSGIVRGIWFNFCVFFLQELTELICLSYRVCFMVVKNDDTLDFAIANPEGSLRSLSEKKERIAANECENDWRLV